MLFTVNKGDACKVGVSNVITESGAYVGKITQAVVFKSPSGAVSVEFLFQNDAQSTFTRLWLTNSSGEEAFGKKIFDALMVVLGLDTLETHTGPYYSHKGEKMQGEIIPLLYGKPIGMLLQRTNREFIDESGETRTSLQMDLVTPFHPVTRLIAREILSGAQTAQLLDKRLSSLKDRTQKARQPAPIGRQTSPQAKTPANLVDDIPF